MKPKIKRNIRLTLIIILSLVLCFSIYQIASYYYSAIKEKSAFDELSDIVNKAEQTQDTDGKTMLAKYKLIFEQNSDTFGWIKIEGTVIDYPVMHTPENAEYYLRKAFDKTYSQSGVPFLSADCFENCGNYLIYGHHMKNGSMFASILNYAKKDYYEQHKIIQFDTLYETAEYEVIAAFRSKVYAKGENGFKYYTYTDLTSKALFDEYIDNVKKTRLYDTGINAEYGDQLLTLSTCAYHTKDGRFVVVARKITN